MWLRAFAERPAKARKAGGFLFAGIAAERRLFSKEHWWLMAR